MAGPSHNFVKYTVGQNGRFVAISETSESGTGFERWFCTCIDMNRAIDVCSPSSVENLLLLLRGRYMRGYLQAYDFLFQMPEWQQEEWVKKAIRDYIKLRKEFPDNFPAAEPEELFDRIRAYRKERKGLKKMQFQ